MKTKSKLVSIIAILMLSVLTACASPSVKEPSSESSVRPASGSDEDMKEGSTGNKEGEEAEDKGIMEDAEERSSEIFFTSDISADGLVRIYEALGWEPQGKCAVKISTGEPPQATICGLS